jgi:hypothetical protein
MSAKLLIAAAVASAVLLASATSSHAWGGFNGLSTNGVKFNGLSSNGANANALAQNALAPTLPTPADSALGALNGVGVEAVILPEAQRR